MTKFRHVYIELYDENVYFIECSQKQYIEKMRLMFRVIMEPGKFAGRFRVCKKDGKDICVIWINNMAGCDVVAHECFHATYWILNNVGIWLHDSSDEAYAYLQQYLMRKINQFRKG
jgi:hypothetical protein